MILFRMHDPIRNVFDTGGAAKYSARWHTAGTLVVYAAEHISLAALELLVHSGGRKIPPRQVTRIHVPDDLPVEECPWLELPHSRTFGDTWVHEARSPLLKVPSIVANKLEFNYLINPAHPQFPLIAEQDAMPFAFDPRFIHLG